MNCVAFRIAFENAWLRTTRQTDSTSKHPRSWRPPTCDVALRRLVVGDISVVENAVAEVIGRAPKPGEITLRPPAPHQRNLLYDVHVDGAHLIAKQFTEPGLRTGAAREYQSLQIVGPLDIAPRPILQHEEVVVYAYLEGEMWDRRVPWFTDLGRLAQVWIQLHALPTDGLWIAEGQRAPWSAVETRLRRGIDAYARAHPHTEAAEACELAFERCLGRIAPLATLEPLLVFCRSDPRFANVIARPDGRIGLVDWEDAGLRDPAREVADLLLHPNQEDLLSLNDWSAFMEPYVASRASDRTFERRLDAYLPVFALFWLNVLLEDGLKRSARHDLASWRVNTMDPNERLRRYLARCLAWPDPNFSQTLGDLRSLTFFTT